MNLSEGKNDRELQARIEELEAENRKLKVENKRLSKYKAFFDFAPAMMLITEHNSGKIIDANPYFAKIFGFERKELIGNTTINLGIMDIDERNRLVEKIKSQGKLDLEEAYFISREGDKRFGLFSFNQIEIEGKTALISSAIDITETKKIEKKLRASERRFRELADLIPAMLYEIDLAGNVLYANKKSFEVFKIDPSTAANMNIADIVAPEYRDVVYMHLSAKKDYYETGDNHYQIIDGDGVRRDVLSHYTVIREKGEPVGYRGLVVDITDRVENEALLAESEERFRQMADNVDEGLAIIEGAKIVYVNRRVESITGYSREEIIGNQISIFDLAAPEEEKRVRMHREKAMSESALSSSIELWILRKDGGKRFIRSKFSLNLQNGEIIGRYVLMSDITDKRISETSLRENEEKYKALFQTMRDPIFLLDPKDGAILEANEAAVKTYGWRREELLMMKTTDISAEPEKTATAVKKLQKRIPLRLHKKKSGEVFPVEISSNIFTLKSKQVLVAASRDISDRIKAEKELENARNVLRDVLDQAPQHIHAKNYDGVFIMANKSVADSFNMTPEELIGKKHAEIAENPDEARAMLADDREVIETGQTKFIVEEPYTDRMGALHWLQTTKSPIEIGGEKAVLIVAIDITQRRIAENALKRSREKMKLVLENSLQSFVLLDSDLRIELYNNVANERSIRLTGLPLEIGKSIIDYYPEEFREAENTIFDKCLAGEMSFSEIPLQTLEGVELWFEVSYAPVFDKSGKVAYISWTSLDITARKKIERKLIESERRLAAALESADIGIWDWSVKEDKIEIPEKTAIALNLEIGDTELTFEGIIKLVHPEHRNAFAERAGACLIGKNESFEIEFMLLSGRRGYRWISAKGSIISRDEDGKPERMLGVFAGVHERKEIEKALVESEKQFRRLVESIDEVIFSHAPDGEVFYVSPAIRNFGYEADEIVGKSFYGFLHESDVSALMKLIKTPREAEEIVAEFRFRAKRGGYRHMRARYSIVRDSEDSATCHGALHDITKAKEVEFSLRQKERDLDRVFEASPFPVAITIRSTNEIIRVNNACKEFFQWTGQPLNKINVQNFYANLDDRAKLYERLKKDGVATDFEVELTTLKNESRWAYMSVYPITYGEIDCFIVGYADITQKKFAEKALKRSQEKLIELNATKDRFFSIIAHDLKNPIGSFRNVSDQLLNEYNALTDSERKLFIKDLSESSRRLFDLLQNLLTWSRSQRGQIPFNPDVAPIDLIVDNTLTALKLSSDEKRISIKNNTPKNLYVYADPNMLSTVIRNIVSNAIKFTPEGGEITISAAERPDFYELSIKDSGVGISSKNIKKLFRLDSAHTTEGTNSEKGAGLGLILCKEFIDRHKGKIFVESELGKGSKFFIRLPKVDFQ